MGAGPDMSFFAARISPPRQGRGSGRQKQDSAALSDQPQAMERALTRHDQLLRQAIDVYGGQVVKTVGDAFQAVFTTAPAALEAALAAQRALAAETWGPIEPIRARMAVFCALR